MRPEILALMICGFFAMNTYYDGYYVKQLISWKKYYVMGMWGFLGISVYLFLRNYKESYYRYLISDLISQHMVDYFYSQLP